MTPTTAAVMIVACMAVEAFFSGSEIALVSANRVRLQVAAEEGDQGAALALKLLENEEALFATCLIGTQIAVASWATIAASTAASLGVDAWAAIALTPLGLIIGEALPKAIFSHHADVVAPRVARGIDLTRRVLRPAIAVVDVWGKALRAALGKSEDEMTREELIDMLDQGDSGPIRPEDREFIEGVLNLKDITACDAMTPLVRVVAVSETATVAVAAETAVRTQHSRLPVYRGRIDHITGMIHQNELLFVGDDQSAITAHMSDVTFVPEHKPADELFREMRSTGDHFAVVVDEYGGCIGIVTLEDLLEELVGDIEDERAVVRASVVEVEPGVWDMPGNTDLSTVSEAVGVELPEGPYETIAGLLLVRFGRIPDAGHETTQGDVVFMVTEASDRAVRRVRAERKAG
jgi:putative hemolysin